MACDTDEEPPPNQPPVIRITGGAADSSDVGYRVTFQWAGTDPDGYVDHYLYAVDAGRLARRTVSDPESGDPPSTELTGPIDPDSLDWQRIDASSGTFVFPATTPVEPPPTPPDPALASDWHLFAIRAVDDDGAESAVETRYFNATTIAPVVLITHPPDPGNVPTTFAVRWSGADDDGPPPGREPVGYLLKMVEIESLWSTDDEVRAAVTLGRNLLIPDSLVVPDSTAVGQDTYHAADWWPKIDAPYRAERYPVEGGSAGVYAFAVRAVDEARALTPDLVVSGRLARGNVLKLRVDPDFPFNPLLLVTETNLLGSKLFRGPGDPPWTVDVPADYPLEFQWLADASWYGGELDGTNFALDIPDPDCDDCTAPDGIGGWIGWGDWMGVPYPIEFSEEQAGEEHILWIRARDESGRHIRAAVVMTVFAFTFDRTALLVDDFKTVGISDCEHDAIVVPMVEEAVTPYLEAGDTLDTWGRDRLPHCGEANGRPVPSLALLTRYKLLYWNVADPGTGSILGLVTDPSPTAVWGKYLRTYVQAGGNVILWGRSSIGAALGDFYPQETPYNPDLPEFTDPNFGPGTFVWDVMKLRTQIDRVGRGTEPRLSIRCSGIVGLEATARALADGFPAGALDPSGYSTDPTNTVVEPRTAIWLPSWDGRRNLAGAPGADGMTGAPPLHVAGLDTLYTFVTNAWSWAEDGSDSLESVCGTPEGSAFERQPIVVRYADPLGTQGKIAWIGTPLYFFAHNHEADLHLLTRRLTDWVFEDGP